MEKKIKNSSWGGKREGAGRKSMDGGEEVTRKMKRKFNEYVSEEEIETLVAAAIVKAQEGDTHMMKFLLEQWFGKATQRQEISGEEGGPIQITGFNYIAPDNTTYIEQDDSDDSTSS